MTKAAEEKADGLVNDYKSRLSPYVNAMKERGYFGQAMKLQQQGQLQEQNQETQKPQEQQAAQAVPNGKQPAQSGTEGNVAGLGDLAESSRKTGGDGIDGDFLSINSDVATDPTSSRAPDVAGATRPAPATKDLMNQ
jgi:hypothetical protein